MSDQGEVLHQVSEIIGVIAAANTLDDDAFTQYVYELVDGDVLESIDLTGGIIAFFFGILDSAGLDVATALPKFGMLAAKQKAQQEE